MNTQEIESFVTETRARLKAIIKDVEKEQKRINKCMDAARKKIDKLEAQIAKNGESKKPIGDLDEQVGKLQDTIAIYNGDSNRMGFSFGETGDSYEDSLLGALGTIDAACIEIFSKSGKVRLGKLADYEGDLAAVSE